MNNYRTQTIIGQGAFGNAYLATHIPTSQKYVIKKVDLTNKTQQQTDNIFNEVKLLQQFKHVCIVSYRESIIEKQELHIVMEYCEGGDMNQLITEQKQNNNGKKFQQKKIIDWAAQTALAIFYMHDKRILHRDLKTPNIFINHDQIKLGDFGISKVLDETIDLASTSIGTPYYMSPEQYRHKPYSYKSDIWAFGCCLYEMCNLKRPFEALSLNGLAVKVLEGNFAPVSEFYSKQLRDLIKKMLQKKQKDRPTILEFLQTPIIKKRALSFLSLIYNALTKEGGDKTLIQGVVLQAKKLGINLQEKQKKQLTEAQKKTKIQFTAEKKRLEKQRIRLQLEEQLKAMHQKDIKQKQELKKLEQQQKKFRNRPSKKQSERSVASLKRVSSNSKISKQTEREQKRALSKASTKDQEERRYIKMEQEYDMYEMEYEQQSNNDDIIEEQDQQQQKIEIKPYQKQKYIKSNSKQSQKEITKPQNKQFQKQIAKQNLKKQQRQAAIHDNQPFKSQQNLSEPTEIQIQNAILNIRQSLKQNNQKLNTLKNQLSNIDFSISSSQDELEKTIERPEMMPNMKKKQKNPLHAQLNDKINDLRQNLQAILNPQLTEKLLATIKNKKQMSRDEIEKLTGIQKIGSFHLANQIIKLSVLLQKIPALI